MDDKYKKLQDVLFPIGSIVTADIDDEIRKLIIIGKRAHNYNSNNTWDYIAAPYPRGYKYTGKEANYSNLVYLNHYDIYENPELLEELLESEVFE